MKTHFLTPLASLAFALTLAACGKTDNKAPDQSSLAPQAMPQASSRAAAPSASAVASALTVPHRKAPKNITALQKELEKTCPVAQAESNVEQKLAVANAMECMRRRMNKDLDQVLLPLKSSDPERFRALMKEQADWNRYSEAACNMDEERVWVDFEKGYRDDGTARGYAAMGCLQHAYADRILYARSLAAQDTHPIAKRINQLQAQGASLKEIVADIKKKSDQYQKNPPKHEGYFLDADWPMLSSTAVKMQSLTEALAKSSCEGWSELAEALGGKDACQSKMSLYYWGQMKSSDETP